MYSCPSTAPSNMKLTSTLTTVSSAGGTDSEPSSDSKMVIDTKDEARTLTPTQLSPFVSDGLQPSSPALAGMLQPQPSFTTPSSSTGMPRPPLYITTAGLQQALSASTGTQQPPSSVGMPQLPLYFTAGGLQQALSATAGVQQPPTSSAGLQLPPSSSTGMPQLPLYFTTAGLQQALSATAGVQQQPPISSAGLQQPRASATGIQQPPLYFVASGLSQNTQALTAGLNQPFLAPSTGLNPFRMVPPTATTQPTPTVPPPPAAKKSFPPGPSPGQCIVRYEETLLDSSCTLLGSGDREYCCPWCAKKFSCRNDFRKHTRTHTGICVYPCDVCGQEFKGKDQMQRHKRAKHPKS